MKFWDVPEIVSAELGDFAPRSQPDNAQLLAVKAALGGSSFIIEGPPGTGKTASIVAIAETLSKSGKRVLITAAMPGAVGVLGRRLIQYVGIVLCRTNPGDIDLGPSAGTVDLTKEKPKIVIGTPLAILSDILPDDRFDVLIVDESSQMRLSHALAIASHASQIIVAGDSSQLQPHDDVKGDDVELSLLASARNAGFPSIMLDNHYRSNTRL